MKASLSEVVLTLRGPSIPTNPSPKKVVERETEETTDKEQTNFQGSTAQIPPSVIPISIPELNILKSLPKTTPILESDIPKSLPKPNISYPLRRDDQKSRDKASNNVCEEYALEFLGFSNSSGSNPTPTSEPFTSEFILEEIEAYLKDDSISPEINYADCNSEEDILTEAKSSIEEPPELELKDLPSHLEYAFLEENDKLPVIIAKDTKRSPSTQRKLTFTCPYGTFPRTSHADLACVASEYFSMVYNTIAHEDPTAPILVVPDWNLPFELMCDASDFAIGAVLGQRKMKHFQPIHYASKTMTEAQIHYTTTEKEMLAVVYAFEKF
ncbi:reverse transcriptase domain-containing protein [Tanacetum coccineum]